MLPRIRSFLTIISFILLLLTTFLWLHSRSRYDIWNVSHSISYGGSGSALRLAIGHNKISFNLWHPYHPDSTPQHHRTLFEFSSLHQQDPFLYDGSVQFTPAGFAYAHHPQTDGAFAWYLGLIIRCWVPTLLFAILPTLKFIPHLRRCEPLRLTSRLLN